MKSTNPLHILLTTRRVRRAEEIRLIDAEKLKRKLIEGDGHDDDRFTEGYNFAINEIRGYIDSMLTFSVESVDNGWISVKDRLPDVSTAHTSQLVMVFSTNNEYEIYFDVYNSLSGKFMSEAQNGCKVTHWLPLNEPPKGE